MTMLLEKFIHFIQHEKRYSTHTITSYTIDLNQFFNFLLSDFQVKSIRKINYQLIRSWITKLLNDKISTRTVNRKIATLKTYFRFLIKEGVIEASPMQKIISPKTSKRLPVFVNEIKMDKLLDEIEFGEGYNAIRDRLILELFYLTGIRLSELINLKRKNIDFVNETIRVLGKRKKELFQLPLIFYRK